MSSHHSHRRPYYRSHPLRTVEQIKYVSLNERHLFRPGIDTLSQGVGTEAAQAGCGQHVFMFLTVCSGLIECRLCFLSKPLKSHNSFIMKWKYFNISNG